MWATAAPTLFIPDGRIEADHRDHSLVKRLEELGHITPEEAANYPHRNVLYRALGQGEILDRYFSSLSPTRLSDDLQ